MTRICKESGKTSYQYKIFDYSLFIKNDFKGREILSREFSSTLGPLWVFHKRIFSFLKVSKKTFIKDEYKKAIRNWWECREELGKMHLNCEIKFLLLYNKMVFARSTCGQNDFLKLSWKCFVWILSKKHLKVNFLQNVGCTFLVWYLLQVKTQLKWFEWMINTGRLVWKFQ